MQSVWLRGFNPLYVLPVLPRILRRRNDSISHQRSETSLEGIGIGDLKEPKLLVLLR